VSSGREATLAAVVASAPVVRNALPAGASWDGNENQYAGEEAFRELLSEREPVAQRSSSQ